MNDIIAYLEQSISDELFSKTERKTLRALIDEQLINADQLNFLRSKVYELASQKASPQNFQFILNWVKDANSALLPKTSATANVGESEAFFSPGESCRNVIIQQINSAIRNLKICVFTISDDRITDSIFAAHRKGVDIKVITDNDKSLDLGSDIARLVQSRIVVKMDDTPNHMHHKFIIVDDQTVITGSYNWTQSAARFNQENLILTKEAVLVKSFLVEFDRLWNRMVLYR